MTSYPRVNNPGSLIATNDYEALLFHVPANRSGSGPFSRPHTVAGTKLSAVMLETNLVRLVQADWIGKVHCDRHHHDYIGEQLSQGPARLPVECLDELNRNRPGDCNAGLALVDIDMKNHCYRAVLANHPAPLVRQGDRAAVLSLDGQLRLVAAGPSDGAVPWLPFRPGSLLVLPTSGVLNAGMASRGERFGMRRLKRAIEAAHGPREVLDSVCRDVVHHLSGHPLEDDLTLLLIARGHARPHAPAQKSRPAA
jgi:Stage II sporulation protein E (SpoIIE)